LESIKLFWKLYDQCKYRLWNVLTGRRLKHFQKDSRCAWVINASIPRACYYPIKKGTVYCNRHLKLWKKIQEHPVEINLKILGGTPVVRGTRIPAHQIPVLFETMSLFEIYKEFPTLRGKDIWTVEEWTKKHHPPTPKPRPWHKND
jgi:uncharacterized protein (DUF433 family)